MLSGSRHVSINDQDERTEDFEGKAVVETPRRRIAREPLESQERRFVRLRAILALKNAGWPNDEIAIAIGVTERHIRRRVDTLRELSRAADRMGC